MTNIGFLGFGNMANSIVKGISQAKDLSNNLRIFAFDLQREKIDNSDNVEFSSVENILKKCKYVFLAVKPQNAIELFSMMKENINPNTVYISIMAGITSEYIKNNLGENLQIMLVMPNTPLIIGAGATSIADNPNICYTDFQLVCDIFQASGEISIIPEDKMNEIIPIAASGVGFFFYFSKQFFEYADNNGIDYQTARKMIGCAMVGSGKMILNDDTPIEELINRVCSKGGTTFKGIEKMNEHNVLNGINEGLESCKQRANELSQNN